MENAAQQTLGDSFMIGQSLVAQEPYFWVFVVGWAIVGLGLASWAILLYKNPKALP